MQKNFKKQTKVIFILILLIIGLLIYLFLDKNTYVSKFICNILKININVSHRLLVLRNYLPDLLWVMAFTLTLTLLTKNKIILFIPVIIGTILEFLQLFGAISGTFDIFDILVELFGAILIIKFGR